MYENGLCFIRNPSKDSFCAKILGRDGSEKRLNYPYIVY